jgi:predicted RNA-binding Zn ribbon-like protein
MGWILRNRQNTIRWLPMGNPPCCTLSTVRTVIQVRNTAPFQLAGGHPGLDFVNTLDWRFRPSGPQELMNTYDDLLRFTEQCGLLSLSEVRQLRATAGPRVSRGVLTASKRFREVLGAVLYNAVEGRTPSDNSLRLLSSFMNEAQSARLLDWRKGRLTWTLNCGHAPELPLWKLSIATAALLASEQSSKVRACGNAECRWLFLDTSKNQSRRWCDMNLCGNRLKARRFRQKQ